MDIYYFSGTGNSLHVAKELHERFPEARLLPMVRHMKEPAPAAGADVVGFVFPIHLTNMPYPVEDFIEKLNVDSASYLFAAATRISTYYIADIRLNRILRKKGKALDAFFIMNMAANSPCGLVPKFFPGFKKMVEGWIDRIAPEKLAEMETAVQEKLDLIVETVGARRRHWDGRNILSLTGKHLNSFLMSPMEKSTRRQTIPFTVDADCTACGLCEEVCLSGRIALTDSRPVWRSEIPCWFCYACFNSCPEQAILVKGRYEKKLGRYLNPSISAADIAAQK